MKKRLLAVTTAALLLSGLALSACDGSKGGSADDFEDAVAAMTEAAAEVREGEVTTAVRDSAASDGTPIHGGDVMGIIDDSIDIVGSDVKQVTLDCINRMQADEEGDSLTILAGSDMDDEAFQDLLDAIEEAQPDLEIDAHRGEQPLYPIIFSIE